MAALIAYFIFSFLIPPTGSQQPTSTSAQGIEVSPAQGPFNWTTVKKQGYSFVYYGATQGFRYVNYILYKISIKKLKFSNFKADGIVQLTAMKKAGLIAGAHHFGQHSANKSTAQDQALFFKKNGGKMDSRWKDSARSTAHTGESRNIAWAENVLLEPDCFADDCLDFQFYVWTERPLWRQNSGAVHGYALLEELHK